MRVVVIAIVLAGILAALPAAAQIEQETARSARERTRLEDGLRADRETRDEIRRNTKAVHQLARVVASGALSAEVLRSLAAQEASFTADETGFVGAGDVVVALRDALRGRL